MKKILIKNGVSIPCIMFIILLGISFLLTKDKETSNRENRPLQQMPHMSYQSICTGTYQKEMESYISDQFPLRMTWVQLRTNMEYKLGKKEFNDIYIGKEDTLFQKSILPSDTLRKEKAETINSFAKRHSDMNISLMIVPNKATIWEDKLPINATIQSQLKTLQVFQKEIDDAITVVDSIAPLRAHKSEYIYYRSDHHWTSHGAYIAFDTWKSATHPQDVQLDYQHYKIHSSFYGTLANTSAYYSKTPDEIDLYVSKDDPQYNVQYTTKKVTTTSLYDQDKLSSANPYEVFLSGNEPLIDIFTTVDTDRHLLVIKDSFANAFIPFLLPYYSQITVVDPRYYFDDLEALIRNKGISETLFLYNANTFFSDYTLQGMLSGI